MLFDLGCVAGGAFSAHFSILFFKTDVNKVKFCSRVDIDKPETFVSVELADFTLDIDVDSFILIAAAACIFLNANCFSMNERSFFLSLSFGL